MHYYSLQVELHCPAALDWHWIDIAFKETEDGYLPNIRQLLLILTILPITTTTIAVT